VGFEKAHLFGKIEVDVRATSPGTFALSTDVPGVAGMVERFSFRIPVTSRRTLRSRLPGAMVGHLVSAVYTPDTLGQSELYGVRAWVRELPAGQWYWFPLPVVETPAEFSKMTLPVEPTAAEFSKMTLPVEPTGESFTQMQLPVPATPVDFSKMTLPVEPTAAEFSKMTLPVEPTGESFTQMQLPVPATPADFSKMTLPVEPTGEGFTQVNLPVKTTPPVPAWVDVQVDA
jgi:hypothetical protein